MLKGENVVEVVFLAFASLYSFVIILKNSISLLDMGILFAIFAIFAGYVWRRSQLPKGEENEAPEIVITIMFVLKGKPAISLGALVSSKINQWTLLIGMIPLVYSIGADKLAALLPGNRQYQELFLAAAQSVLAVSLIFNLKLGVKNALILLGLFLTQFVLGVIYQGNQQMALKILTIMAWVYLASALTVAVAFWHRKELMKLVKTGLLKVPKKEHFAKLKS